MLKQKYFGINYPFKKAEKGFYLDLTNTEKGAVKSNLYNFLLTKKGERLMRPEFGTSLLDYIFEPLDDMTAKGLAATLKNDIVTNFKGLNIDALVTTIDEESKLIGLEVDFSFDNGIFSENDILIIQFS